MQFKIIITLICMGFLFTNTLHAGNLPDGNTEKVSGTVSAESPADAQADSDSLATFGETGTLYLPFVKTNKQYSTGAITIISPEDLLQFNSIHDISSAITGLIPGGMGGLNIRGLGNALVVIDGIPRPIESVNIEEVEQITVVRDVNAAILYGVQANNGLILITTKRGQPNVRKVKVSVEQGFSTPISLPNYLNSADYMELYNEARDNDGLTPLYTQADIDNTRSGTKPAMYPDADYYTSDFLKNSKPTTRVVTQFSGGNENAQYYLTAGYNRAGTLLNMGEGAKDNDQRLNLRSNVNFRINDFIKSYVDVVAIWDLTRRVNGNFWSDASNLRPNLYTPLIDTALVTNKTHVPTATLINGRYMAGGRTGFTNNIYANLHLSGYYNQTNTSVQFNNGIDVDLDAITQGLSFKTFIGFDFYNQFRETQTNTYAVYQPVWSVGPANEDLLSLNKIGQDVVSGTKGVGSTVFMRNLGFYGMLDYTRIFDERHAVNASLIGFGEYYTQTAVLQPAKFTNLAMRVNYAYDNKYVVDFNSALVSSTKLHKSNRVGFAPSIGLGWILSEEDFLQSSTAIDFLKLKVSMSNLLTDVNIPGYYLYEGTYVSSSTFTWNDGGRSLSSNIVNTEKNYNLFYEIRKELNAGLEAVLFNRSLWLDANVFSERKTDLVAQPLNTYPDFLGGIYPYENYGEEKYTGFEIGATWRKPVNSDLLIEIGGNMVYLTTEVVKRDERWEYDYLYRAGKPVSAMFGLEAIGLFRDEADIAAHEPQAFGAVRPGDIKYKDQNGDGVIDVNDEIMIAQSSPKLYAGLNLKVKYRDFTLFALATGRSGSDRYFNNAYYWVYGDRKYSEVVLDRWTPATATTAAYPRLTTQSSSNNYRASTFWLYDNSLITLNRLQLNYDLPGSLASRVWTKNASIYLRASNLVRISKNPEKMNLNIGSEPQYIYYSIGLRTTF